MKALTIWEPWATAISARRGKRIENRTWAPSAGLLKVGDRIAIHAGRNVEADAIKEVAALLGLEEDRFRPWMAPGCVVAFATFQNVLSSADEVTRFAGSDQLKWWHGPRAWLLRDVVRLPTPLAVRGAQGLWDLPADIEAACLAQLWEGA